MMEMLLKLLERNARYTNRQLASMLGTDEEAVTEAIAKYEKESVICGYKAIVNWDSFDDEHVTALIELKVTPKPDWGFDDVAERILQFEEVESCYLMSGSFDIAVLVTGRTFKEIAMFVAKRLSTLDSVISTSTHFVLKRYKDGGVFVNRKKEDERGNFTL